MIGAVLAGGQSRRLRRDKATLVFGGEALWVRQSRVLREAGAGPIGIVRAAGQDPLAAPLCWRDRRAAAGPLAGIEAALLEGARLRDAEALVAVLAVDMPGMDAAWFRTLEALCRPGLGAVGGHAGAWEPLAAIYPVGAVTAATRRLDAGDGAVHGWARELVSQGQLRFHAVAESDATRFRSVNAPADLGSGEP